MRAKLFFGALSKFLLGVLLVGALIFLPAGTLCFWRGWLLMGILFVPMFVAGIVMMLVNPKLLHSRLDAKESRSKQDLVVKLSGLMFVFGFVVAGLGFRLDWVTLPKTVTLIGAVLFCLSYALYAEVLRENTFLSRTIKVEESQTVIDTGLYALVRHPMYLATLFLFLSMPLVLGSLFAFIIFLLYPFIITLRIKDEEAMLLKELAGYKEYTQKVKYRLIPFIW